MKKLLLVLGVCVLNLIITGIPSILVSYMMLSISIGMSFKPYYNWNTFNTVAPKLARELGVSFKPYYNWNTFNTEAST